MSDQGRRPGEASMIQIRQKPDAMQTEVAAFANFAAGFGEGVIPPSPPPSTRSR